MLDTFAWVVCVVIILLCLFLLYIWTDDWDFLYGHYTGDPDFCAKAGLKTVNIVVEKKEIAVHMTRSDGQLANFVSRAKLWHKWWVGRDMAYFGIEIEKVPDKLFPPCMNLVLNKKTGRLLFETDTVHLGCYKDGFVTSRLRRAVSKPSKPETSKK